MDHFAGLGLLFIILLGLGLLATMRGNRSDPKPIPTEADQSQRLGAEQSELFAAYQPSEPETNLRNEAAHLEANKKISDAEAIGEIAEELSIEEIEEFQENTEEDIEEDTEEDAVIDETPKPLSETDLLSETKTDLAAAGPEPIDSEPVDSEPIASPPAAVTLTEAESELQTSLLVVDASDAVSSPAVTVPQIPIAAIADRHHFDSETFKQTFVDTLRQLQGQSPQTATVQDCYATLAVMVRQRLLKLCHPQPDRVQSGGRIIGEIATEFCISSPLETNLTNLGLHNLVAQALQELGLNLDTVFALDEAELSQPELGTVTAGYLESLATARLPAIGYSLRYTFDSAPQDDWEIKQSAAGVQVKFGGETQVYTGTDGRLRVRWTPQQVVQAVPYDTLIPGYGTDTVSLLRRWQADAADLCQPESMAQPEEQRLKQRFFLASCAIQDIIWRHEQAGESIETLPEQFVLQLNDTSPGLAIAELMHWLVDEYELEWHQSWGITQKIFSCTLHNLLPDDLDDRWSIPVFSRLLPRHLEIIYEINHRFLQEVSGFNTTEQIKRLSLIDESGDRSLRLTHLICLGSAAIRSVSPLHSYPLQRTALADFAGLYPAKFGNLSNGINPRRYLVQSNPYLANLLTQWLGADWITRPQLLRQLEELVQDPQFCGDWWQTKRQIKQEVAVAVCQQTGIEINLNSLFDVQAVPIAVSQRQLLNLLHVITLYVRLKVNATTDTIQHFTHRSVPRTCFFVGEAIEADPIAPAIVQLIQAVATTINNDPEVQGKLQVIVLENDRFQAVQQLYGAADLVEYLPLAAQVSPSVAPYKFALNGAITLGSFDSSNLALQQEVGAQQGFLFGMNVAEVSQLQAKGYDPAFYYSTDPDLQQVITPIASGYFSFGDTSVFKLLGNWLLTQDPALVLAEYQAYLDCQERVSQSYQDQKNWTRMSILTTARMGKFLSDRTIQEYQQIWQISPGQP